jgi:hypothetical protein
MVRIVKAVAVAMKVNVIPHILIVEKRATHELGTSFSTLSPPG